MFFPVLVQSAPSTSSAASGRCSRISPSRGLVEGLVLPRCSFPEPLRCRCELVAAARTPLLKALMQLLSKSSSRATCAFTLSQRCGSDVILASSSCLAVYVRVLCLTGCVLVLNLVLHAVNGEADPSYSSRFTATVPVTHAFWVLVSSNPTVSCTLSSCHLLVFRS